MNLIAMQAGAITQLSKISKLIEQLRHQESGYLGILMKVIVCYSNIVLTR